MSPKEIGPCVCGSYEDFGFMICCDGCESWMHGPCVKVTKKFATGIDDYICPRCGTAATLASRTRARPRVTRANRSAPKNTTATSVVPTSNLLKMSDEILIWILTFVRCQRSVCRVSSTCKRLWRVAQDPYLWKHITLTHDTILRQYWDTQIQPRLLSANICELNLLGEISSPVMIDALKLDLFTGLRILRLEDIQTYTVYRLASKLPWLRIFEARRIKGNSDNWDWRPFQNLNLLEELLLWRNEKPLQTFSLSHDALIEVPDDIYPVGEQHIWGGFVQLSSPADSGSGSDDDGESPLDDAMSIHSNQSLHGSEDSHLSGQRPRRPMMPNLKRLALINIVSPSTHRGTDGVMRNLVSRVTTFIHWNSFNILFPIVRTHYERLVHLTMIEACEPAWREGTWQEHAAVFQRMKCLESITLVNPNMNRRFLIPVLDALLSLDRLQLIRLVSTEDIEAINLVFTHVLETRWSGRLSVSIQDDLGPDAVSRNWCAKAAERVSKVNKVGPHPALQRQLEFEVKLFRSEWDEDAGLKKLCLKAWQQTL